MMTTAKIITTGSSGESGGGGALHKSGAANFILRKSGNDLYIEPRPGTTATLDINGSTVLLPASTSATLLNPPLIEGGTMSSNGIYHIYYSVANGLEYSANAPNNGLYISDSSKRFVGWLRLHSGSVNGNGGFCALHENKTRSIQSGEMSFSGAAGYYLVTREVNVVIPPYATVNAIANLVMHKTGGVGDYDFKIKISIPGTGPLEIKFPYAQDKNTPPISYMHTYTRLSTSTAAYGEIQIEIWHDGIGTTKVVGASDIDSNLIWQRYI